MKPKPRHQLGILTNSPGLFDWCDRQCLSVTQIRVWKGYGVWFVVRLPATNTQPVHNPAGALLQLAAYVMIAPGVPFGVIANAFVGSLKEDVHVKFSLLHAAFGLGALVAPLVATHFATTSHWSFHYLISGAIAITNTILLAVVFRFRN